MKKSLIGTLVVLLVAALGGVAEACTTAVFSGKATKSGRPMLWKVRDTDFYHNYISRHQTAYGGWYIGISNAEDPEGKQIWSGHNDRGFAIMNSASFNVNTNDPAEISDREGHLMQRALSECETLEDFEKLLDSMLRPIGIAAHFGVIDAHGGAAIYEVNNYTWYKEDANSAPGGYIVRSNYSETGTENDGLGYVRARTARQLLAELDGPVTVSYVANVLSRSLYNSQLGIDYGKEYRKGGFPKGYILTDDLMPRYDTASVTITEGINPGDDPDAITSWVQIALPYVCPLTPVWAWQEVPEELALPEAEGDETIATLVLRVKERLFPLKTVEKTRYLYLPVLFDRNGEGLLPQIQALEQESLPAIASATNREERTRLSQSYLHRCVALLRDAATPVTAAPASK